MNHNASLEEVNVIGDDGEHVKDETVHDKYPKAERDDDDGAQDDTQDWFQEKVEQGEYRADRDKLGDIRI